MVKILIITHGSLGVSLLETAELIVGKLDNVYAMQRLQSESLSYVQEGVFKKLREIIDEDGVLIMTDLFGGTPCNAALSVCKAFNVEVLSGVSLPMLIAAAFACKTNKSLADIAQKALAEGQKSALDAKKVFFSKLKSSKEV
ncbi:MAG: PTS sugar transporter subunit IIA [Elusimicrobia bacterium]|nr:PTS sugar transporter subunit IIA [Elusimicrobiota bacterium]